MASGSRRIRQHLLRGIACAGLAMATCATPAFAATAYHIRPQSLDLALRDFGLQSGLTILADAALTNGKTSQGIDGPVTPEAALDAILRGSGLTYRRQGNVFVIRAALTGSAEGNGQAAAPPAAPTEQAPAPDIIVTAQKRAESIQSVPIAVSAFSAKSLDDQKIEGGSELMRAVPNVTFSKSNFASYNFSIRGVGTKALSVTSDPGVAISFNNTPLLRNRLFEQEYFDVQRVEVLRGPQGTLYGRNATAGVVNMIPNFASPDKFASDLKLEGGNYGSMRASGMLNIPLTDTLAIRGAGAWTSRDGYDYNTVTNRDINGRNLWGTRLTASWEPSSRFKVTAAWEHFYENDDRARTGKQLCHNDPGPSSILGTDLSNMPMTRGELSQGCSDGSLYTDSAYGVPNGLSLPYVQAAEGVVSLGYLIVNNRPVQPAVRLITSGVDPYAGVMQSRNLREVATSYDPTFRAKNDIFQLNVEFAVTPEIKFHSQSAYSKDFYYSTQDYNRFVSNAVFNDSSVLFQTNRKPNLTPGISPGGILTDPQLGASNRILGVDMVRSRSEQWYQEFRLQSSFDGPLNFSVGENYLYFKIDEDYYVFNNVFTAIARTTMGTGNLGGVVTDCADKPYCAYVDPNPLSSINGQGHNYFRSRNLAETESYAAFGEVYWKPTGNLKFTAGLRYTDDKKTATPVPSQLLLAESWYGGGLVGMGYPESPDIVQKWRRVTGRFVVDWNPHLSFTDDTLFYASYARGYKGGGANPPSIGADPKQLQFIPLPATFRPESVNAFEIGMKNTLAGGRLTLNADAFFYNYKDYQVSQIVDRSALNENYDANMWGAELEVAWRPTPRLRFNGNVGYLGTRIANGMKSIDVMNRTQGNPDWTVVKPWIQLASNCIAPTSLVQKIITNPIYKEANGDSLNYLAGLCGSSNFNALPQMGITYNPATDAPNQGRGFYADLGGKELPNAPHWTMNLGAQYTLPIGDWGLTLRSDYYRQGASWARVYNDPIDRLKSWDNANLSLTLERPADGLAFQFYVKNVFDKVPITDAFLNSDDSGLTANVFTLDPRIIGFSIAKRF